MAEKLNNDNVVPEGKVKFTQSNIEVDFDKYKLHKSKLVIDKIKLKDFMEFTLDAYQKHGSDMYSMLGFNKPSPF